MFPRHLVWIATFAAAPALTGCTCSPRHGPLQAVPDSVNFGTTAPGSRIDKQVFVTNEGTKSLNVTGASIDKGLGSPFLVSPSGGAPLGPGESIQYTVSYVPAVPERDSARAIVHSDAPLDPDLAIALTGIADSSACVDSSCTNPPGPCYRSSGACSNGSCVYPLLAAGSSCDDLDPCTTNDACSASGTCAGTPVTCNSPPAPTCLNATTQRWYAPTGQCGGTGTCSYTYTDSTCSAGCDGGVCSGCTPTTCTAQGYSCGTWPDGCGGSLSCGACGSAPPPTCLNSTTSRSYSGTGTCSSAGACTWTTQDTSCPNGCSASTGLCASCTPTSCIAQGKNCGSIPDGCGGTLSCGTCPTGETCGGGGTPNVCAGSNCSGSCVNWTDCKTPGTGCDSAQGCCVPCGGNGQPCCVDFTAGKFFCNGTDVCGQSSGTGTTETYYCCANQGDGCCVPGGCGSIGNCCLCPQNGLNFCVDPAFGCGGCP